MSYNTFLIICAILVAIPFIVSCIKGNPIVGMIAGFAAFLVMGFAVGHGASMMEVHAIGLVIAGLGTAYSLHGD